MKKIAILLGVIALLVCAVPALAKGPGAPAGKSNEAHLYLYEKIPSGAWPVVEGGAWGKMTYGSDFVFNGHGLEPKTDYTLIRYTDPWPGTPVTCLASGVSNAGGNLNLSGTMQEGGYKVWLVLTGDVECGVKMTGWNPTAYLFEGITI